MKIIYYSKACFADCDIPLIKSMQMKGLNVFYYIPIQRNFIRSSIIEFSSPVKKIGIICAKNVPELSYLAEMLDLSKVYLISGYRRSSFSVLSWILWLIVILHMSMKRADIFHITWQLSSCFEKLFYILRPCKKIVMTVHDPFSHTGNDSCLEEKNRMKTFNYVDGCILLNKTHIGQFIEYYKIREEKIFLSRLGTYDVIKSFVNKTIIRKSNYILPVG